MMPGVAITFCSGPHNSGAVSGDGQQWWQRAQSPRLLHHDQRLRSFTPTRIFITTVLTSLTRQLSEARRLPDVSQRRDAPAQTEKNLRLATSRQAEGLTGHLQRRLPALPIGPKGHRRLRSVIAGSCISTSITKWLLTVTTSTSMAPVASRDLQNWEEISSEVKFPKKARHGSILPVPQGVS